MRKIRTALYTLSLFLVLAMTTHAGNTDSLLAKIQWHSIETPIYKLYRSTAAQTVLQMDYASADIKYPRMWSGDIRKKSIYEVDLVFTNYPSNKSDWLTNYDTLLHQRMRSLTQLIPELLQDSANIQWNLILQTDCSDETIAQKRFHGAVVKYKIILTKRMKDTINRVRNIVNGQQDFADSVVFRTFDRHPEWSDILVVNDLTGSMYDYSAQAVLWHRLHKQANPKIKYFTFFNDGDLLPEDMKQIGNTGGIYWTPADSLIYIARTMKEVMISGYGGEDPENDIEALLEGIHLSEGIGEVILIADNNSPVRDMVLLPQVTIPVRVVLCGADSYKPIHEDYLEIARSTGGSIHTIEEDITQLSNAKEGAVIMLLGLPYEFSGGRWKPIPIPTNTDD